MEHRIGIGLIAVKENNIVTDSDLHVFQVFVFVNRIESFIGNSQPFIFGC